MSAFGLIYLKHVRGEGDIWMSRLKKWFLDGEGFSCSSFFNTIFDSAFGSILCIFEGNFGRRYTLEGKHL